MARPVVGVLRVGEACMPGEESVETVVTPSKKDLVLAQFNAGVMATAAVVAAIAEAGGSVSAQYVDTLRTQFNAKPVKAAKKALTQVRPGVVKRGAKVAKKAAKKVAAKKAKAPAFQGTKVDFVRSQATDTTAKEVVSAGKAVGVKLTEAYVYKIRSSMKVKKPKAVKAAAKVAATMSKVEFVRSLPEGTSYADAAKGAKKVGIELSKAYFYVLKSEIKKAKGKPKALPASTQAAAKAPKSNVVPITQETFRQAATRIYLTGVTKASDLYAALESEGRVKGKTSIGYLYTILGEIKKTHPAPKARHKDDAEFETPEEGSFLSTPSLAEARKVLSAANPQVRMHLEALAFKVGTSTCTRILAAIEVHHTALAGLGRAG